MDNSKYTFHLIHHSITQLNQTINNNITNIGDETQNVSNAANINQSSNSGIGSNEIDSYEQKFFDISDQISLNGHSQASVLTGLNIEQAVVSNTHIAFLLDNGRACRVSYQYNNSNITQVASQTNIEIPNSNDLSAANNSNPTTRTTKHSKICSNISSTANANTSSNSSALLNTASVSFRQSTSSASSRSSSFVTAASAAAVAAVATNNSGVNSSGTNLISSNLTNSNASNASLRANESFIIPSPHDILSSSSLSHTLGRGY